jgi:hypothetical protein
MGRSRRRGSRKDWGLDGRELVYGPSVESIWNWSRVVMYVSAGGLQGEPSHITIVRGIGKTGAAGRFTVGIGTIGRHG